MPPLSERVLAFEADLTLAQATRVLQNLFDQMMIAKSKYSKWLPQHFVKYINKLKTNDPHSHYGLLLSKPVFFNKITVFRNNQPVATVYFDVIKQKFELKKRAPEFRYKPVDTETGTEHTYYEWPSPPQIPMPPSHQPLIPGHVRNDLYNVHSPLIQNPVYSSLSHTNESLTPGYAKIPNEDYYLLHQNKNYNYDYVATSSSSKSNPEPVILSGVHAKQPVDVIQAGEEIIVATSGGSTRKQYRKIRRHHSKRAKSRRKISRK